MKVFGALQVDLTPAVDDYGFLDAREAWGLLPAIPSGVTVELHLGRASAIIGSFGEVLQGLRPAGTVVVIGTNPAGVGDVVRRLRIALPDREAS